MVKHLYSHLQKLLRPYWKQVFISAVFLVLITIGQLVIPEIVQQVIDVGLANRDYAFLGRAALLVLGIGVGRAILFFFQRYTSMWIAQKVAFDLRNNLYDHIQRLSFSYHDRSQTGQLISRCIEDVSSTNQFMGGGVIEFLRVWLLITGITVLLFLTNWKLAIIALLPMVPLLMMTSRFGVRISKLFLKIDRALGDLSSRLQENVTGAQVVKAFAREPFEIGRFEKANRRLYETRVETFAEFAKVFPTTHLLITTGTILILWIGGLMVINGQLTIGEVVAFNAYLLIMAQPAQQFTWVVNMAGEAVAGLDRIYEVLDTPMDIASPDRPGDPGKLSGQISFENLSFRYQGEEKYALHDINLHVESNQVVALIGPTGSGKTSLINLIPRFYDPQQGRVLVDGIDVRDLALPDLRKQIGIVLQTSLLFSDSIAENIAFGRPTASDEEIVEAAKAAQAHKFIEELPEGYSTIVGERGITLSGGQRQRVAIARALLVDPRILILDDSTSSVDMETEHLIQQALEKLMEGRTTFVIAHRLSTVKRADKIIVIDAGRIVQRGTHEELLEQVGLYREIYELQLKDQEEFAQNLETA